MTPALREARTYLQFCQRVLDGFRRDGAYRGLIAIAERRVLAAIDMVWLEQCRVVFEPDDESFFETPECIAFVNQVDWPASGVAGTSLMIITMKEPA